MMTWAENTHRLRQRKRLTSMSCRDSAFPLGLCFLDLCFEDGLFHLIGNRVVDDRRRYVETPASFLKRPRQKRFNILAQ